MSKNIDQVYIANPITSNTSTDLMYFGQSPYGAGNDAAMTYANFSAQFGTPYTASALTKTDDANVTITLGGTPATALLHATSLTMGWNGTLAVGRGGLDISTIPSNGMVPIGNGTNYTAANLTPGTGISVSNGSGTITISTASSVAISFATDSGTATPSGGTITISGSSTGLTTTGSGSTVGMTGTLTAGHGGSGLATLATYALLTGGTTSTGNFQQVSAGNSGQVLQSGGSSALPAFSTATYPSTATSTGTVLRANGTNWVASTSTFADTYSANSLLYSNGANTVTGLATANSAVLVTSSSGIPAWSSTMTNGQLIIGSTTATPTAATLTAGTGISITNGAGSITIASSGAELWVDQTTSSVTMVANKGYTADAGASLITFTLPTSSAIGDWIEINGKGSGLWTIAQASGQQIQIGTSATTLGATGTLSSVNQYDNVRLRCLTANTIWTVVSQQSSGLTIV